MCCAISCTQDAEKFRLTSSPCTALVNENKTAAVKLPSDLTSIDPLTRLRLTASNKGMRKK